MVVLGPLSGVRVVDMSRILAGPLCTMMLGDLGAEVIKLEKPTGGDETRNWGPPFVGRDSTYFLSFNRNKKSVAVDIQKAKGQQLVRDLVSKADVFVENYLPGKLKAYGLDYDNLRRANSKLVYCSISGFGQTGPWKHRAGYDVIVAGIGGFLNATGPEGGEPCRTAVAMTDFTTGLHACCTIISSLYKRERVGKSDVAPQTDDQSLHIDCNLLSSQISILSHLAAGYLNAGVEGQRIGTAHQSIVPYQAFCTSDNQWFIVGCGSNANFIELCDLIKMPELANDSRFRTNADRVKFRSVLIPLLKQVFQQETLENWEAKFKKCAFPHGPINNFQKTFAHEQTVHNNVVINLPHSAAPDGVKLAGPPWRVQPESFVRGQHETPPSLGQHTRQTLSELLGYSDETISKLYQEKVVA